MILLEGIVSHPKIPPTYTGLGPMCLPPDTCIHFQPVQLGSDTSSSLLSKGASLSPLKNALPCSSRSLLQASTSFNPIPWAAGPGLTSVAMNAGRCFLTRGFSAASTLGHASAGRAQPLVKGLLSLKYPESSMNPNHSSYVMGEKKTKNNNYDYALYV